MKPLRSKFLAADKGANATTGRAARKSKAEAMADRKAAKAEKATMKASAKAAKKSTRPAPVRDPAITPPIDRPTVTDKAANNSSDIVRIDAAQAVEADLTSANPISRMPGSDQSTALGGPGPESPTDKDGNFKGKPGEDVQMREPLAPTERRNTVVAASVSQKPETNVSRSDTAAMAALVPEANLGNFDIRTVPPAVIDADNAKALEKAHAAADKV